MSGCDNIPRNSSSSRRVPMLVSLLRRSIRPGRKAFPLAFVLAAFVVSSSLAQEPNLQPRTPAAVSATNDSGGNQLSLHLVPLRVNVDLVLVPVTVLDQLNRPVLGLAKDDFILLEDNTHHEIRYFSAEDAPLSVGILLDVSGSMTEKIDLARAALGEFFENGNPSDDYFVITFSDSPEVLADATLSIPTIRAKLADVKPSGQTALLDAIYMGEQKLRSARYQRKALLIISDGGDNHSRFTSAEVKNMVMESDVLIYGIGVYSTIFRSPEEWSGKRLLTQITEATGGHTVTVRNPRELPDAARSISTELRNQYVLGYAPSAGQISGWRKITVKITPRDHSSAFQLHWRKAYMGSER